MDDCNDTDDETSDITEIKLPEKFSFVNQRFEEFNLFNKIKRK